MWPALQMPPLAPLGPPALRRSIPHVDGKVMENHGTNPREIHGKSYGNDGNSLGMMFDTQSFK